MSEPKRRRSAVLAPIQRNTLKDQCYTELRRALISGRFEPGENVTVKLLAEQLQSGTMPVREAVQRLVAEGAFVNLPSGRICVPDLSREEFEDIVELRLLLEPYCCFQAAMSETAPLVKDLGGLQQKLKSAFRKGSAEETLWANHQLHFRIYGHASSRLMFDTIESIWLRFGPIMTHTLKKKVPGATTYVRAELKFHDVLSSALANGDGKGAQEAMKEIIQGTANWYLNEYPFNAG